MSIVASLRGVSRLLITPGGGALQYFAGNRVGNYRHTKRFGELGFVACPTSRCISSEVEIAAAMFSMAGRTVILLLCVDL